MSKQARDVLPFVGRERVKSKLIEALAGISQGSQRLAIAADAGLGKTRLLAELADLAAQDQIHQITVHFSEAGAAVPLQSWRAPLSSLVDADLMVGSDDTLAKRNAETLITWLDKADAQVGNAGQRGMLFSAIAYLVKYAITTKPMVLCFDDIHRADSASLELLKFIMDEVSDLPLMIVLAYRPKECSEPLNALIDSFSQQQAVIELQPLQLDEVKLLMDLSGAEQNIGMTLQELFDLSRGNPLLLDSLYRARGKGSQNYSTGVPATAELPPDLKKMLSVAAVLGTDCREKLLAQICRCEVVDVYHALDQAESLGVLIKVGSRFKFRHDLLRAHFYKMLSAVERSQFHLEAADALINNTDEPAFVAESVAYHYFEAWPLVDFDILVNAVYSAVAAVMNKGGFGDAIELLQRIEKLLAGELSGSPLVAARIRLLLADAYFSSGQFEKCLASYSEAYDMAFSCRTSETRNELLVRSALGCGALNETGASDPVIRGRLEYCLSLDLSSYPNKKALVLGRLAEETILAANYHEREKVFDEALSLARASGDCSALAETLSLAIYTLHHADNLEQRIAFGEEILELTTNDHVELRIQAHNGLSRQAMEAGNIAKAEYHFAQHRFLAMQAGSALARWVAEAARVSQVIMTGDMRAAEESAGQALKTGKKLKNAAMVFSAHMFCIRYDQGRLNELKMQAGALPLMMPGVSSSQALKAWVLAQAGSPDFARETLVELASENQFAKLPQDIFWFLTLNLYAETAYLLRHVESAQQIYRLLLPYRQRCTLVFNVAYRGSVELALGWLALTMRRFEDATEHFRAALRVETRMGAMNYQVRALIGLAESFEQRRNSKLVLRFARQAADLSATLDNQYLHSLAEGYLGSSDQQLSSKATETIVLKIQGEMLAIEDTDATRWIKTTRGVKYLLALLTTPNVDVLALDLVSSGRLESRQEVRYESLDPQAISQYKQRLKFLCEERDELEGVGNALGLDRINQEIDFLQMELQTQLGLNGASRIMVDNAEKARQSVTKAIKASIKKINSEHSVLGKYLSHTVITGRYCCFQPDDNYGIAIAIA